MIIFTDTQTRLGIAVASLFLGLILAAIGFLMGNEPLIQPDLREAKEIVWRNQIDSQTLAEWILSGRNDFLMMGYREGEHCLITVEKNRFFECFKLDNVKNPFWLRRHFPNLKVPMVVYNSDGVGSLEVGALLQYYGYKVRLLKGGYKSFIENFITPVEIAKNMSGQELKSLERKQLLYWYFSGKDPNIGTKSYGGSSLYKAGNVIQDDVSTKSKDIVSPVKKELVPPEDEDEGC
jgi:hypothetical protein